jgi:hypothetical protein
VWVGLSYGETQPAPERHLRRAPVQVRTPREALAQDVSILGERKRNSFGFVPRMGYFARALPNPLTTLASVYALAG